MPTSGFLFPITVISDATTGTNAWGGPDNAKVNDGVSTSGMVGGSTTPTEIGAQLVINGTRTGSIIPISFGTSGLAVSTYGGSGNLWGITSIAASSVNASGFGVSYMARGMGGPTQGLKATNFNFALPAGAAVSGVEVEIERGYHGSMPVYVDVDYIAIKVTYTEAEADTTAPALAITFPTTEATYSTAASSITLSGSATDAVGVTGITWTGPSSSGNATFTAGTSAPWSVTGIVLASGSNAFTLRAYDSAGNMGSGGITVTYTPPDTTAPTVTITAPTTGTTYSTAVSSITLTGTATDSVGVTGVTWTSPSSSGVVSIVAGTNVSWSASGIALVSGSNTLTVRAFDLAGNSGSDVLTATYTPPDTTAPSVAITFPTSDATYSTAASSISISGTASDNVAVTGVTWETPLSSGICIGTTSWNATGLVLSVGSNLITVKAYDASGNVGNDTLTVTYTESVDTTPPVVAITLPTTNPTYSTTSLSVDLSGTATDANEITRVTWESPYSSGECLGTTSWSAAGVSTTGTANLVVVTAYDVSGNAGSGSILLSYTEVSSGSPLPPITPKIISQPFIETVRATDPASVLLANLYVSAVATVDSLSIVDTRRRGGGVEPRSDIRKTTLTREQQNETSSLWDIATWDGTPTITNGAVVIKIPALSLTQNGGNFTHTQIEELVNKNVPVGILPVIEYI